MPLPRYEKPDHHTTARMQKVLRWGTDLERSTASILRQEGIKYRSQPKIKGNPDFRIVGKRVVIFCDSSFWHGRWLRSPKAEKFHKNQAFWNAKLLRNLRKDRRITRDLKQRGWFVLRFWDEEILQHPNRVASRMREALTQRNLS
jgi:DNA mismatch endonuclease, patch repair protein